MRTTVNRRYRIERKIGEGGMAEVYLGFDEVLQRPVAVKSLRPQYAADPTFRLRFEREAQAAAGFSHPNIIDIFDVGEERGAPYIVMEYVPGETLKQIIAAEGPFDPDDVAILVEQVASALDYAHERGFVHRDIKPQNILVDAEGLAKVVDFGIAKGLADSTLTEAGSGLGTVHYLSPEQANGLMATPSSDIYALGVVAYEMLTGRLPFESDSAVGVAMKHLNEQPVHLSALDPAIPRQVGDIVLRALAKDPTRRFASAGDFARTLNDWRYYGGQPAPSVPRSSVQAPPRPIAIQSAGPSAPATRPAKLTPLPAAPADVATTPAPDTRPKAANLGCASWLVGVGVVLVLIGLIWAGSRLADRDDDGGLVGADATATRLAAVEPDEETPTPRPTRAPTIAPAEPTEPALVTVPDLTGRSREEAEAILDDLELRLEVGEPRSSSEIGESLIVSQEPPADEEVEPGATIVVRLSSGPEAVDLAALDLPGQDPDEAQARLEAEGLVVERREETNPDVDRGRVSRVEPADEARPGETVILYVSRGTAVQIPRSIQGGPVDEAVATLEGLGLVVNDPIPVSRVTIEDFQIDLDQAGIVDGDVVGIQDNGADFDTWIEPGAAVTLVYYDASLDEANGG